MRGAFFRLAKRGAFRDTAHESSLAPTHPPRLPAGVCRRWARGVRRYRAGISLCPQEAQLECTGRKGSEIQEESAAGSRRKWYRRRRRRARLGGEALPAISTPDPLRGESGTLSSPAHSSLLCVRSHGARRVTTLPPRTLGHRLACRREPRGGAGPVLRRRVCRVVPAGQHHAYVR